MINSITSKIRFFIIVSVFIFPILFSGCADEKVETVRQKKVIPVIVKGAEIRPVEYKLNQVGSLEADKEVMLRSEIEGKVTELFFTEGSEVKQGEVLVQLDNAKIQAEIHNLNAQITQLNIRMANKKKELERNRPLLKQNLVSPQLFDNLKTEIDEIEAQITQAKANLALQRERLDDTKIVAPFDGIAGARNISIGDYLKEGDPILLIVDLDPVEISFQVSEKLLPEISIGQETIVTMDSYPDREFQGNIFFISPDVHVDTRTAEVKARINNEERLLKPGMFAQVAIVYDIHENALTIPTESIIQTENETFIYIVDDQNRAHKITIQMGKTTDEWTEVLNPQFTPDAKIIVEGKYAVNEGSQVEIQQSPAVTS